MLYPSTEDTTMPQFEFEPPETSAELSDRQYMAQAIRLAEAHLRAARPNPTVAAILVRDGEVIGQGVHVVYGGAHAESLAIQAAREKGKSTEGATLYVTLEPCCHQGKTPPCTEAIIQSGIRRVVIGTVDPNPKVSGKGIEMLRAAGVEVLTNCLADEAAALNPFFNHFMQTGLPFVSLKAAITLDGKLANEKGQSQWITGPTAREKGHQLRQSHMAIMVGAGTLRNDLPSLTARTGDGHLLAGPQPLRVTISRRLNLPQASALWDTSLVPTRVYTSLEADPAMVKRLKNCGVEVAVLTSLDLKSVLKDLGEGAIDSVLVEGGAALMNGFLSDGSWQALHLMISMRLMGGQESLTWTGGQGSFADLSHLPRLSDVKVDWLGEDLYLSALRLTRASQGKLKAEARGGAFDVHGDC